jgi:hypothetical protein
MDDPYTLLDRLEQRWLPRTSLVVALEGDALLAWIGAAVDRGDDDAVRAAVPRLLRLAMADRLTPVPIWHALGTLHDAGWQRWSRADQDLVVGVLDSWWVATLIGHPSRPDVHEVLVAQTAARGAVRPLLDRWLTELDGPGAIHLAELVRDDVDPVAGTLVHPGWGERPGAAREVVAWARSEPVVLGLTLVGGVHLEPGLLSEALDRLL